MIGLITGTIFTFTGTGTGCLLGFGRILIFSSFFALAVFSPVSFWGTGTVSRIASIDVFLKENFSNGFPSAKESFVRTVKKNEAVKTFNIIVCLITDI